MRELRHIFVVSSGYIIGVLYILVLVVWIKENSIAFSELL